MTSVKEFAEMLNGREIGKEITQGEVKLAKENNLVVVYGASDDLMEFEGAITKEIDCWMGVTVYILQNEIIHRSDYKDLDSYSLDYKIPDLTNTKSITSEWDSNAVPSWQYYTDIPHETFDIMEDGEVYCRGIVFSMDNL